MDSGLKGITTARAKTIGTYHGVQFGDVSIEQMTECFGEPHIYSCADKTIEWSLKAYNSNNQVFVFAVYKNAHDGNLHIASPYSKNDDEKFYQAIKECIEN
jgi:hypothetical protein